LCFVALADATDADNIHIHILGRGILDTSTFERMDSRGSSLATRGKNVTEAGGCIHLLRCKNVTIANLRINGRVVRSLEEAAIKVGPHVQDVRVEMR
jgi:hypothetical protein